jgi:hypothetical protein
VIFGVPSMSRFMIYVIWTDIIISGCSRSKTETIRSKMSYAYSITERKTHWYFALSKAYILQPQRKKRICHFACLFFVYFYTATPILTKFVTMTEDLTGEVTDRNPGKISKSSPNKILTLRKPLSNVHLQF